MKHAERRVIVTKDDEGGWWLHFAGRGKSAALNLGVLMEGRGPIVSDALSEWFVGDDVFVDGPPAAKLEDAGDRLKELGELLNHLNVPFQFGLRQQGKLDTVAALLAEGKSWNEIGAEIGWHGPTAQRFYEMETKAEARDEQTRNPS